jgi:hypothetical protein
LASAAERECGGECRQSQGQGTKDDGQGLHGKRLRLHGAGALCFFGGGGQHGTDDGLEPLPGILQPCRSRGDFLARSRFPCAQSRRCGKRFMCALQGRTGFTQRLIAWRITKAGQGSAKIYQCAILGRDQRPMRGIIAYAPGTISNAKKLFRRATGTEQRCLTGNFIIGEQAARPGRLAACGGRAIHGAGNFLAHFFDRGHQGGAEDAMRGTQGRDLSFRFLACLLFRFQRRTQLAKRAGQACAGSLNAGGDIAAAQQAIQAIFHLARMAASLSHFRG